MQDFWYLSSVLMSYVDPLFSKVFSSKTPKEKGLPGRMCPVVAAKESARKVLHILQCHGGEESEEKKK